MARWRVYHDSEVLQDIQYIFSMWIYPTDKAPSDKLNDNFKIDKLPTQRQLWHWQVNNSVTILAFPINQLDNNSGIEKSTFRWQFWHWQINNLEPILALTSQQLDDNSGIDKSTTWRQFWYWQVNNNNNSHDQKLSKDDNFVNDMSTTWR